MSGDNLMLGTEAVVECSHCNKILPCTWMPDPFQSDVHGDETPMWICEDCAWQSNMDI